MAKTPIPFAGKMRIKSGDVVMIISGRDKGKTGTVSTVLPLQGKVIILDELNKYTDAAGNLLPTPLNSAIKHVKGQPTAENPNPVGGRMTIPLPIHISKVALVNSEGKPTRIRIQQNADGTKTRIAVKGGQPIPNPERA